MNRTKCRRHDSFRAYGAMWFTMIHFPRLKPAKAGGWQTVAATRLENLRVT